MGPIAAFMFGCSFTIGLVLVFLCLLILWTDRKAQQADRKARAERDKLEAEQRRWWINANMPTELTPIKEDPPKPEPAKPEPPKPEAKPEAAKPTPARRAL